jgi:hypothetical protein
MESYMGKTIFYISFIFIFYSTDFAEIKNHVDSTARDTDYGMVQPDIISPVPDSYNYNNGKLDYFMTIGCEGTKGGRIYNCWVGGGDNDKAFLVLNWSDDKGNTWSEPKIIIDPHDSSLNEARRVIVAVLWSDPDGRLWIFFDQAMTYFDGRAGIWASYCDNPDSEHPVWSKPEYVWYGCVINKPIVLSSGEWVLPAYLWPREMLSPQYKNAHSELDSLRTTFALISTDKGRTLKKRGDILFPHQNFDEPNIIEKKDGSLWITARTLDGIYQSFSSDKGFIWTEPSFFMDNASTRHFIRRLKSGNLLLVKNGDINKDNGRTRMFAYLSNDDGRTWNGGLLLDERSNVTYPDGFQDEAGNIYVSYDIREKAILMARFNEQDILDRSFNSVNAKQKIVITPPYFKN